MSEKNTTIISEEVPSDICLYDRTGTKQTFENIETIIVDTPDGIANATFTFGKVIDNAEYELDFSNGDCVITLNKGDLLKNFTIKKPSGLVSENIVTGANISGVDGGHECYGFTDSDLALGNVTGEVRDVNLSSIVDYAFAGTGINAAYFPSCSQVGKYAFAECVSLNEITLDYSNISVIESCTFMGTQISSANLPSCTEINASAFQNCKSITKVIAPSCSNLYAYAFDGCTSLSSIVISPEISIIYSYCFRSCQSLKNIDLQLRKVYEQAFCNCTSLEEITTIVDGWCYVGAEAFSGCTKLSTIDGIISLNDSFGEACNSAFNGCANLQSITFGYGDSNPEHIPYGIFCNCSSLSILKLCSTTKVFPIEENCFWGTPMSSSSYLGYYGSIQVPSTMYSAFKLASGWSFYASRMVSYSV